MASKALHLIHLFELNNEFIGCIVIPFPSGGMIKDTFVFGMSAMLLVESDSNAEMETAHFHAVNINTEIVADDLEYVGLFSFPVINKMLPVYKIIGEFGAADGNKSNNFIKEPKLELSPDEYYELFGIKNPNDKDRIKKK